MLLLETISKVFCFNKNAAARQILLYCGVITSWPARDGRACLWLHTELAGGRGVNGKKSSVHIIYYCWLYKCMAHLYNLYLILIFLVERGFGVGRVEVSAEQHDITIISSREIYNVHIFPSYLNTERYTRKVIHMPTDRSSPHPLSTLYKVTILSTADNQEFSAI